jgi:hypothetical protein
MSPQKRLSRYFELVHKGTNKTQEEFHEMCHLEEALVDDMEGLYPDYLKELLWTYVHRSIDLLVGGYAILDTGSSWNVMEVLNEQMEKVVYKDRRKIQDIVALPIACGGYYGEKEYKEKYNKKKLRK